MNLADLFYLPKRTEDHWAFKPITRDQLIEVLEDMGAFTQESYWVDDPGGQFVDVTQASEDDRRYLVLPLDE